MPRTWLTRYPMESEATSSGGGQRKSARHLMQRGTWLLTLLCGMAGAH